MAVNGSDKSKFSLVGGGGDDEDGSLTFKRHTSREKNVRNTVSSSDDDDDVPQSQRLSQMMNFGTWSSNRNVPTKKRTTATRPAKRTFENINSLQDFVKKSKDTEKDHNPLSREVEMEGKSAESSFSLLKNELSWIEKSFEECKRKRQEEEERLQSIKRDIEECDKDQEIKEAELSLMDDLMVERNQELRTKNIEIYNIDKVREGKEWELNAIEKQIDKQAEILQSEKRRFHGQMKEQKLRERQLEEREKELELKEEEFKSQVKELESKKKQFEGQEKLLDDQVKAFESKKEKFKSQVEVVQELKRVLSQMEDFQSEEKQFERRGKELDPKEKQLGGCVEDFESREKQHDALIEPFDEEAELGNQSSPTSEQNDELESVDDDILVNLQAASDPSKVVLDIILNPVIKKCKIGDDAVIIDDSHILLLKELRKISPDIRPHVREEAMKLALAVKANMQENNDNSLVALGFLLLLSIYGLVPSFDEDDVFKLFGLVSQYNITVELFGDMGFADKISEFVENLIMRQQYDEAVRFGHAYNFSDNDQLVSLFEEHVQNLKLISESSCKETNSIEIKEKARDQEIASLMAVMQCIKDNNLEFKDLLNKIDDHVLELRRQNGK